MITISARGLPRSATEESLTELFSQYGKVHSLKIAKDLFSGECKGFATIDMEGHEAREAMAALDHSEFEGKHIRVSKHEPRTRRRTPRRRR